MSQNAQQISQTFVLLTLNLGVLMWGISGVFAKWVEVDPFNLTFWRMIIAYCVMVMIYMLRHKGRFGFDLNLAFKNLICGALLAIHWFCFFKAIQLSTVALGIVFHASFVFMVAALEPFLFKAKINKSVMGAAIIGSLALILILYSNAVHANPEVWLYGFLTAACYAALSLINRGFLRQYDTLDCMTSQFIYGAVLILPFYAWQYTDLFAFSSISFVKLLALGIFTTALGHSIYFWSLRHITATKASVLTLMEPVYGIFFGMLFLNEVPNVEMIVGSSVVILCAGFVALFSTVVSEGQKEDKLP